MSETVQMFNNGDISKWITKHLCSVWIYSQWEWIDHNFSIISRRKNGNGRKFATNKEERTKTLMQYENIKFLWGVKS